jgi:RNA polymerase sigma-70 factor (ECF subfamily)
MQPVQIADPQEVELISRSIQGDHRAWESLVAAHQEAVFRLAYLFLGDEQDAQDIAQETFTRAYLRLDQFDIRRPARPWLLAIAANLAKNRRRSITRYLGRIRLLGERLPAEQRSPVEKESETNLAARELWKAVSKLKQADQELIYLRYFLELSIDETANAMQIPSGTVKSRLHRTVAKLRQIIQQDYPLLVEMMHNE